MDQSFAHDVFVSYSHRDRDFVRKKIVSALRRKGLDVWWDERFAHGSDLNSQIEEAIRSSRKMLVVMTKHYLKSGWTDFEQCLCQTLEHDTRINRMLILKVGSVAVPLKYRTQVYKDIAGAHELDRHLIYDLVRAIRPEPVSAFSFTRGGSVLAIRAHWDDILLGCLGTLLMLKRAFAFNVDVLVMCNSYTSRYYGVSQDSLTSKAAAMYVSLCKACGFTNLGARIAEWVPDAILRDKELHKSRDQMVDIMDRAIARSNDNAMPYNLILTPPTDDSNRDHAITGELAFSQFREPRHALLEYEIKRYTDHLFAPNFCVCLDHRHRIASKRNKSIAEEKIHHILDTCQISNKYIRNAERLFSRNALLARMTMSALDYSKSQTVQCAEIFRGRFEV